jgi:hypothetical protein
MARRRLVRAPVSVQPPLGLQEAMMASRFPGARPPRGHQEIHRRPALLPKGGDHGQESLCKSTARFAVRLETAPSPQYHRPQGLLGHIIGRAQRRPPARRSTTPLTIWSDPGAVPPPSDPGSPGHAAATAPPVSGAEWYQNAIDRFARWRPVHRQPTPGNGSC